MIPWALYSFVFLGLFSPGPNVILLTTSGATFWSKSHFAACVRRRGWGWHHFFTYWFWNWNGFGAVALVGARVEMCRRGLDFVHGIQAVAFRPAA